MCSRPKDINIPRLGAKAKMIHRPDVPPNVTAGARGTIQSGKLEETGSTTVMELELRSCDYQSILIFKFRKDKRVKGKVGGHVQRSSRPATRSSKADGRSLTPERDKAAVRRTHGTRMFVMVKFMLAARGNLFYGASGSWDLS